MHTRSFASLAFLFPAFLFLLIAACTGIVSSKAQRPATSLVVHEWGTFTSVSGHDGITLEWRPLTVESELPSFVYSVDRSSTGRQQPAPPTQATPKPLPEAPQPQPSQRQPTPLPPPQPQPTRSPSSRPRELRYPSKSATPVSVRMETPVVYFYAKEDTSVSVQVDFVGGKITEWYPQGRNVQGGRIDWGTFKVVPDAYVELPNDFRENHYYPARETNSAPIQVKNSDLVEYERFLFYRGVGDFDLPLSIKLEENRVRITNEYGENICKVVLFENREGKIGYRIQDMPQTDLMLDRPALDGKIEGLREEIKAMLISQGLFEKEADAMLKTWRDSWFEEGLRVFYIMPRKTTDAILPIAIDPKPSELVRVLVGRMELITPEIERNVTNQITKLASPSKTERDAALKAINKYGRFREPILTQIRRHTTDSRVKAFIDQLL